MDAEILLIILLVIGYITYILYKKHKRFIAKKIIKLYSDYIDNFKLDVFKSYRNYQITNKILVYENNTPIVLKSKKYMNSDLESAFFEIKNKLSIEFNRKMFLPNGDVIEDFYLELNNIFKNDNEIDKLKYTNGLIKTLSINIAIENYNSTINSNHEKSLGAQFIALVTFENETKVGRFYPEGDFKNMSRLLIKRKQNPDIPFLEFLENFV